ncbi:MAG: hypothetical protein GWP63_20420 [Haliea sp.]|jgi:hypothetical protein|nr:hypothetical protein [Haliea sp.]
MKLHRIGALLIITFWFSISAAAQNGSSQNEQEVMNVLDAFMRSFSARDPEAHTATYHFPHFRLAQGNMASWHKREDAINAHKLLFKHLPSTGWHRSEWIDRKIISISDSKAHVATRFRRLREDGSEIVATESLYVLTKKNGRWGIKLRSSYL